MGAYFQLILLRLTESINNILWEATMKKLIILLLMACVLVSISSPAFASDEIRVYVDDELLQLDEPPIIQEGRTLVPMRALFESLGASVEWEADTHTAVGERDNVTVRIPIGSTMPTINNRIETIEVAAQILDGRTYIPLRFVGEAFGDDVHWDGDTRSITITRAEAELADSAEPDREDETKPIESLSVWVEADPEVVPEGGGQTVTINVTVADNHGYLVEGADVSFFAEAFEAGERTEQLSPAETRTDELGQARATYTTLEADDRRFVTINMSIGKDTSDDYLMEFMDLQIMAADRVASVSGVVKDPFTGNPLEGVHIHFMRRDINRSIGFVETDPEGRYAATVPTDHYGLSFNMEIRDDISVNVSDPGKNYTVDNKKGILKGVITGVSPGKMVMAIGPGFRRDNPDNWTLQAEVQDDGSFVMALFPGTYEVMIAHPSGPPPFKTGVSVQSGQVTDLGTVRGR